LSRVLIFLFKVSTKNISSHLNPWKFFKTVKIGIFNKNSQNFWTVSAKKKKNLFYDIIINVDNNFIVYLFF